MTGAELAKFIQDNEAEELEIFFFGKFGALKPIEAKVVFGEDDEALEIEYEPHEEKEEE